MKHAIAVLVAVSLASGMAGQTAAGPYAGQERREIKALSPAEVAAYEAGEGMGYAKAAELNHYPGPRHVLELEKDLRLTATQAQRTREIRGRMHERAVRLGKAILDEERNLDRLFAQGRITRELLAKETAAIARLEGELRLAHLEAHLETRAVLTPDQIRLYDERRGYGKGERTSHPHGAGR